MLKKLTFLLILLLSITHVFAQDIPDKDIPPRPTTLVNDYANVLSPDSHQMLERKLDDYNDSTSTQIAVVLVHSIGDYDINNYGTALGRKWGIGEKGKNNGLLILASIDQRKITIQTGYGMEGSIPDAITNQIINEDIKPHFRQGDYYGGLDQATTDIIKYAKGEYKGNPHHKNGGGNGAGIIVFIIIIFILIIIFRGRGGGGQIIGGRGGASPFWWFLAGDILGSSGRGGGDGGWGGFSGGGDSGGGGGFGGFGGGSFGGGGSSGSW